MQKQTVANIIGTLLECGMLPPDHWRGELAFETFWYTRLQVYLLRWAHRNFLHRDIHVYFEWEASNQLSTRSFDQ
jgi:hypothetical protein